MHKHIPTFTLSMLFIIIFNQEYLEFLEKIRHHEIEALARKYRAIGPLLTKMEGLVAHTNTGNSPKLHQYYSYWESQIFQSILKVSILNSKIESSCCFCFLFFFYQKSLFDYPIPAFFKICYCLPVKSLKDIFFA